MLRKTLFVLCLVCTALLLGCGNSETTNNSNSTGNPSGAPASNSSSSSSSAPKSEPISSVGKIGVPECDDFITKYETCVSQHVPEAQRAAFRTSLMQWRDSWKQLAVNPATKGTVASACKQAMEQQKKAMKSWGCEF